MAKLSSAVSPPSSGKKQKKKKESETETKDNWSCLENEVEMEGDYVWYSDFLGATIAYSHESDTKMEF